MKGGIIIESNKFLQLPIYIINDKNLQPIEHEVYALIYTMLINNEVFYASNDYIAKLLHRTPRTISKIVTHLVKQGYITTQMMNGKRVIKLSNIESI